MSGIITSPPAPTTLVSISPTTLELALTLNQKAEAFIVQDAAAYENGNALFTELHDFAKALEANRKEVKAPYLEVCNQIDASCKRVAEMLTTGKERLGANLLTFQRQENARREEEARKAREEAARIERERIAAAEAARQAEIEQQILDTPPGEEPPPVEVFTPPDVQPVIPAYVPPPLKGAIKSKTTYELVVDDLSKVPVEINGVRLLVLDEKAALQLCKAGMVIPGLSMRKIEGVQAKGART